MYASFKNRLLDAERRLADARRRRDTAEIRKQTQQIGNINEERRMFELRARAVQNRYSPFRRDGSIRPLAMSATSAPSQPRQSDILRKKIRDNIDKQLSEMTNRVNRYKARIKKRQEVINGMKSLYATKKYKIITKDELSRSGLLASLSKVPSRQYTDSPDERLHDARYRVLIDDKVNGIVMKDTDFIENSKRIVDGSPIDRFFKSPEKAFIVLERADTPFMGHTTALFKNGNNIEYFDANGSKNVPENMRDALSEIRTHYLPEGFNFNELEAPLQNRGLCARFVFDRILDSDKTLLEYLEANRGKTRKDVQENIFLTIIRNQRVGKSEINHIDNEIKMYTEIIDGISPKIQELRRIRARVDAVRTGRELEEFDARVDKIKTEYDEKAMSESLTDVESAKTGDEDLIDSLIVAQRRAMGLDSAPMRPRADAVAGDDDDDEASGSLSETVDDFGDDGRERMDAVGDDDGDGDDIQSWIRSLILP